jgi:hypothetical protein
MNENTIVTQVASSCSPATDSPPKKSPALKSGEALQVGEEADEERPHEPAGEVHDRVERIVEAGLDHLANSRPRKRHADGHRRHRRQTHAGVMATRPATMPDAAPRLVGCPSRSHSTTIHASPAAAAARNVFMNACTAWPLAASAEPALKPNQPNHRMPVPIITSGMLCGG